MPLSADDALRRYRDMSIEQLTDIRKAFADDMEWVSDEGAAFCRNRIALINLALAERKVNA